MIWRVLMFMGVSSAGAFAARAYGEDVGGAVFSTLTSFALALSEIERRLSKILEEMKHE